jgi:hypothetical protein
VIGGGIAGLTAAREIANIFNGQPLSLRIVVLEARKRIGGRIFTFPLHCTNDPDGLSSAVDLGILQLIQVQRNLTVYEKLNIDNGILKHMLTQLDLKPVKVKKDSIYSMDLHDTNGCLIRRKDCIAALELLKSLELPRAEKLSIDTINELLKNDPLYPELEEFHMRLIKFFVEWVNNYQEVESYRLPGGLGQLTHSLAYGCQNLLEIHCDTAAQSISLHSSVDGKNGYIEVKTPKNVYRGEAAVKCYLIRS